MVVVVAIVSGTTFDWAWLSTEITFPFLSADFGRNRKKLNIVLLCVQNRGDAHGNAEFTQTHAG
jgi:hypothetical protein